MKLSTARDYSHTHTEVPTVAKRAAADPDDERQNFGVEEIAPTATDDDVIGDVAELDDPQYADAKWNVYQLGDDGLAPPGSRVGAFVCKLVGPIELDKLRDRVGGGVFRLIGSLPGRRRVFSVVTIAGPKRIEAPPPPPPMNPYAPPPPPASPYGYPAPYLAPDPIAVLREELREMRRDMSARPATAADPIAMLGAVIQLVKDNAPAAPPAPTEAVIGPILSMLDKGIRLGRGERGESSGNGELGAIVRESLPVILQSLGQLLRPNAPPAPAPIHQERRAARESSSAEVVDTPPRSSVQAASDDPAHVARRLDEIARLLAEAIDKATPTDALLELAEEKLTGEELDQLSQPGATAAHVFAALNPARVSQFPALGIVGSDQRQVASAYVDAFLQALRER